MSVVQIDAHGDLRHAYQDNLYSHASVMARVVDDGLPLVQVGIRSICPEEIERIRRTDRIATFLRPNCWIRPVRTKGKRVAGFLRS